MFRKLRDVPECLGNINGVDYEADIKVRVTTHPKLRADVIELMESADPEEKISNISLDKEYHVHKITSYGDPFDVWIIDDRGQEVLFGEWIFEDIDKEVK